MSGGIPIFEIAEINISTTAPALPALNFGALMGVFAHTVDAPQRVHGPYSTLAALTADFSGETEVVAWANAVFGVGDDKAIKEVYVGRIDAGDANLTASLDAIYAEYGSWYYTTIESRVKADIVEAATWVEAQAKPKILLAQSADSDFKAGTASNVAETLQTSARNRTAVSYNVNSAAGDGDESHHAYRDGAWASQVGHWSLDRYSPPWDFQTLSGQVPDDFTETEVAAIRTDGGNLYAPIDGFGNISRTWPGKMASGRAIHAQCSIDWLKRRMQEAFVQFKANKAAVGERVGIDLAGLTAIREVCGGVVGRGYNAGHLDRDRPTEIIIPRLQDISQADLDAGTVTFTASGYLRKSTDKFVLNFTLTT